MAGRKSSIVDIKKALKDDLKRRPYERALERFLGVGTLTHLETETRRYSEKKKTRRGSACTERVNLADEEVEGFQSGYI